jgi:ABC-type bacteriocin/lantibiotic exporter with double-glycine peptidase domain
MDPGLGEMQDMSHEEFKEIWTGVLVLIVPAEKFEKGIKKSR